MSKPFDISKYRKSITKEIPGMSVGFHDPSTWISTGNYALNYLISGDFFKGIPLGKVTVFAGQSGSGKSFMVSGNIVKHAQEQGMFVILIDSENALDEAWLKPLGVDTSEDKLLKLNMAMINDVSKAISEFIKNYKEYPPEDRPKVLIVIDSLGMLNTPAGVAQFESGELKGDMGIKPKQLKALVTNLVNSLGSLDIGLVATNHTYASQDQYNPDDIVSGGSGFVFASSIVVLMNQYKLKEDETGAKTTEVLGIRSKCKVLKTRFNKPFESIEVQIPYERGMDPYSGLFDLFLDKKVLVKDGNRYQYTDKGGNSHLLWRKEYLHNQDNIMDLIMQEYDRKRLVINDMGDDEQ